MCSNAAFSLSNKISDSFLMLNSFLFLSCKEKISERAFMRSCFIRRDSHGEDTGAENQKKKKVEIMFCSINDDHHLEYSNILIIDSCSSGLHDRRRLFGNNESFDDRSMLES